MTSKRPLPCCRDDRPKSTKTTKTTMAKAMADPKKICAAVPSSPNFDPPLPRPDSLQSDMQLDRQGIWRMEIFSRTPWDIDADRYTESTTVSGKNNPRINK